MASRGSFDPDLLKFLAELRTHNNRPWFEKNKARYERVYKAAFASFVEEFAPHLAKISPYLVADPRPTGGSVMRIYRDTRFSKDKSPYRTYTVVHFGHRDGLEGGAPGLFLYVAPDEISAGGGIWHPDSGAAQKIRSAIVQDPGRWLRAIGSPEFRNRFELTGESLKRPPPGIPKDHPQIKDLVRKDFVASTKVSTREFLASNFVTTYEGISRGVSPMMRLLCDSVGLSF